MPPGSVHWRVPTGLPTLDIGPFVASLAMAGTPLPQAPLPGHCRCFRGTRTAYRRQGWAGCEAHFNGIRAECGNCRSSIRHASEEAARLPGSESKLKASRALVDPDSGDGGQPRRPLSPLSALTDCLGADFKGDIVRLASCAGWPGYHGDLLLVTERNMCSCELISRPANQIMLGGGDKPTQIHGSLKWP